MSNYTQKLPIFIAIFFIIGGIVLFLQGKDINELMSLYDSTSTYVVFSILGLFLAWDKFLWKIPPFYIFGEWVGFRKRPNLNGVWSVVAKKQHLGKTKINQTEDTRFIIRIEQTYTSIFLYGEHGDGGWDSETISTKLSKRGNKWHLIYSYEVSGEGEDTLFQGITFLTFKGDKSINTISGFYANNDIERNRGTLILTKI